MLFLIPGDPGESHLKSLVTWGFLRGVIPTGISMGLFALTISLWTRERDSRLCPWMRRCRTVLDLCRADRRCTQ